jgi:serine/threonine-protein phosphatase PGAM5
MRLKIWAACLVTCATWTINADAAAVRTVYLVRHGAYVPVPQIDPRTGPGLSPLGVAQARLTANRFRAMPVAIASVTSSAMTRARETAAVIQEQLTTARASASAAISECTPPAAFSLNEGDAILNACKQRLDAAFTQFFKPSERGDQHDVLVAHGNVIRYFVMKALGADLKLWANLSVAHASITTIEVHANGAFRIVAVGDAGHLPSTLQSWGDDTDPHLQTPDARKFE